MNKWIDVKKRLPEKDNWRMYAVLTDERDLHKVQVAWFQHSDQTFRFERKPTRVINVTHWLLLPNWHEVEGVEENSNSI